MVVIKNEGSEGKEFRLPMELEEALRFMCVGCYSMSTSFYESSKKEIEGKNREIIVAMYNEQEKRCHLLGRQLEELIDAITKRKSE